VLTNLLTDTTLMDSPDNQNKPADSSQPESTSPYASPSLLDGIQSDPLNPGLGPDERVALVDSLKNWKRWIKIGLWSSLFGTITTVLVFVEVARLTASATPGTSGRIANTLALLMVTTPFLVLGLCTAIFCVAGSSRPRSLLARFPDDTTSSDAS